MADWLAPRAADEWLSRAEMTKNTWGYAPGRLFLGALPSDGAVAVGRPDDRHIVTIAGSRTGKSSTGLLPNLKLWPGSVLAIDPKGELARIAADWRGDIGKVVILDPFGVTDEGAGSGWNPFAELRRLPPALVPDEAALMADALIVDDSGRDSHWVQAARNLVRGLILYLASLGEEASLADLRKYLSSGTTLLGVLEMMSESDAYGGIVAGLGASLLATGDKERDSIISTAATQTGFLDSPGLLATSRRSTFHLSEFTADEPISVFLVLPSSRMPTHYKWLRLFINMALTAMENAKRPPITPVMWMLEEFAQLGNMRGLEAAAGYMAGFGVKLWIVLQDLPQLKRHYREGWETFLGNAGIVQAFGNSDPTTTEYLASRLGLVDVEVADQRQLSADGMRRGDFGGQARVDQRQLLSATEIERLFARETGRALVLAAGQKPLVVNRVHWETM